MVHDKGAPYKAVSEALRDKKSIENANIEMDWYNIVNTFEVSIDMDDKEIEDIFRQIQKYSRSKF